MANKPKKAKHPTGYDKGQHELICGAIKVSPDPDVPGLTAYEGVCILITKLEAAKYALGRAARHAKDATARHETEKALRFLRKDPEKFMVIAMHGTG